MIKRIFDWFGGFFVGIFIVAGLIVASSNTEIMTEISAALGNNAAVRQLLIVDDDAGIESTVHYIRDADGGLSTVGLATDHTVFNDEIRGPAADHFEIKSVDDDKNVRINSRNYTKTSGDASGVQIKPNVSVGGTTGITGLEVSPRFAANISGSSLTAIKADPVMKSGSTDLSGSVKGVECNIDFGTQTGTVSGDVSAYSLFYDSGSGLTRTGNAMMFLLRAPNISQLSHLMEIETGNSTIANSTESGTSATRDGWLLIEVNGVDRYIYLYDGVAQ